MKRRNKWAIFGFFGVILIMVILFHSSSQPYSQQSLVPTIEKLLPGHPFESQLEKIAFPYGGSEVSVKQMGYAKFLEFFLRKGAHFLTYFIMGLCLFVSTNATSRKPRFAFLVAALLSLAFAASDEFHQMLTGDRTPLVQDVLLDFIGAICGALVGSRFSKKYFIK